MVNYSKQAEWKNGLDNHQSPIEIISNNVEMGNSNFNYSIESKYELKQLINDGTTIRLTGNGSANIFHRDFEFQQVHFHVPAEHIVNGHQYPFEIHLVHQNEIGQLVVVALMATLGAENPQITQILNQFDPNQSTDVQIDITSWIDFTNKHGFHYLGSLTTPPITGGVEWLVINDTPITISLAQLTSYQQLFKPNNRNLQPINDRTIFRF